MIFANRNSVLYRWLMSYILILIVPVCLGTALLYNTRNIVVDEYKTVHQALQVQTGKILDSYIRDMNIFRNQLTSNTELAYFTSLDPNDTADHWYSLVKIKQQINSYSAPYISRRFYIYINNIDAVLTQSSLYSKDLAYTTYHQNAAIPQEEWFSYLQRHHFGTVRVIRDKLGQDSSIAMISSLPNLSIYTPRATIVQIFEDNAFSGLLSDVAVDTNTVLILIDDEDNIISASNGNASIHSLSYSSLVGSAGQLEQNISGDEKLIFYTTSSIANWKYVTMISQDSIQEKIKQIRFYTLGFLFFSIMIGSMLTYLLVRYHYRPIRRIVDNIIPYASHKQERNEYAQIEMAFSNLLKANEDLDTLWKRQAKLLQNDFVESALNGQIKDSIQTRDIIASFDIHFISDLFCVLLFCTQSGDSAGTQVDEGYMGGLYQDVSAKIKLSVSSDMQLFPIAHGNLLSVLVNFKDEDIQVVYHEMCDVVLKTITEYPERVFVTAGKVCSGLDSVYLSYHEAMEMMNYKLFTYRSTPSDLPRLHVESEVGSGYDYTAHQEEILINYLISGNEDAVIHLFEDICWNNFIRNRISFPATRCLFFDIAGSALKAISRNHTEGQFQQTVENYLNELHNAQSSSKMCIITESILRMTAKELKTNRADNSTLAAEIIRCVEKHYNEYDFNVSRVADYLSMNLSYISKYFKDHTGIGLYDYISRIRINHAKSLLSKGNVTIKELAEQVGFENPNSFIRVFKKLEGITPGSYRTGD